MKKFRFRLQSVLNLRRQQEDQKKRIVGQLLTGISLQQQQALELTDLIRQQGHILKQHFASGQIDVKQIGYYQGFVSGVQRQIAQKIATVGKIQNKLVGARAELAQSARQTKILEKLKQKKKQRFDYQLRRQESNEMDELANNAFHHPRNLVEAVG